MSDCQLSRRKITWNFLLPSFLHENLNWWQLRWWQALSARDWKPPASHFQKTERKTVLCLPNYYVSRKQRPGLDGSNLCSILELHVYQLHSHTLRQYSHSGLTVWSAFTCIYWGLGWYRHICHECKFFCNWNAHRGWEGGTLIRPAAQPPQFPCRCMCRNFLCGQNLSHIFPDTHHSGLISAGLLTNWSACMPWKDFQETVLVFVRIIISSLSGVSCSKGMKEKTNDLGSLIVKYRLLTQHCQYSYYQAQAAIPSIFK